jgi:hypothetical protein
MSHWNYRTIETHDGWGLYEVYYDDNNNPISRTVKPVTDFYFNIEDLRKDIEHMYSDCQKEPLDDFAQED